MGKMKTLVLAALSAALLICLTQMAPAVDETTHASDALTRERTALRAAILEWRSGNGDRTDLSTSLKAVVSDPAFVALSDDERYAAYLAYGAVLYTAHDWANAQAPIRIATGMPESNALDWGLRLGDDFRLHDYVDAVPTATKLANRWPDNLAKHADQVIFELVREAEKLSPVVESDFLEALHDMRWKPKSDFKNADIAWLPLVRTRLAHGDTAGAAAVAVELHDPVSILSLQSDNRFEGIVHANPERFDVMKAYELSLADLKSKSAGAPDKLEGINSIAELLIVLMRPDEAFTLISGALDRLSVDPNAYSDSADQRNWTEDIRARALRDLGRNDEAFIAMRAGAAQKEQGGINVSQAINLADEYNYFDRPKDALEAISSIALPDASDYGRMALQDARACAYFGLRDDANFDAALDYLRAHKQDGTQPYLGTMLFTGNTDDAAAEVIAELQDPAQRTAILVRLQDYAPDPYPTKRTAAMHDAWIAIRNRPDVAAEIAKVGHINKYALRLPTY